jgi:hypothetical protein
MSKPVGINQSAKPIKATTNPLLQHGPAGQLIVRLQRYALLGWGLAIAVILLHFLILVIASTVPRPVVVVDQSGREIGNIDYLSASSRSDQDIVAASMRYLTLRLSLNSATIYNDIAEAMNIETPEMQALTKAAVMADNYLQRVEKAKSRSWLEFAAGSSGPVILDRKGLEARVRLKGNINIDTGGKSIDPRPFDVTLTIRSAARNSKNTSGVQIIEMRDN